MAGMETSECHDDGGLVVSIDILAPPERVFRALTDPAELITWWDTLDGCTVDEWTVELRVGGRFDARGRRTDGRPLDAKGEFVVVEPPTHLAFRWRPSWEPGLDMTVAYHLEAVPAGTRVTLRHQRRAHPSTVSGHHSYRKARTGSTREARRAGT